MAIQLVGFIPPDDKYKKYKAVYEACTLAGIEVPEEVMIFFDGKLPNDLGVHLAMNGLHGVQYFLEQGPRGESLEVDLTQIPPDIKVLRFYVQE